MKVTGSVHASAPSVPVGGSVTLSWSLKLPTGCPYITVRFNGAPVSASGSRVETPIADSTYRLTAALGSASRLIGSADVKVIIANGATVDITANNQAPLLVQSLGIPNTQIRIADHVELDLSYRESIRVASGVRLIGGRSSRVKGPRLYTRTFPRFLFALGVHDNTGDNVKISGLRIEGAELGIADRDAPESTGIMIHARVNVDVQNNEIYGWPTAGVSVEDADEENAGRISLHDNPPAIRVRDNFIHHSQRWETMGYGVQVKSGAYALVERNVFDYNRHAIASDGRPGTGYFARQNLVLPNGGLHGDWVVSKSHTHQFDMHGRKHCGGPTSFNCGPAGEYMEIRDNAFLYMEAPAFKLRGTPAVRADVIHNVFAHDRLWDGTFSSGALAQTETGLIPDRNVVGVKHRLALLPRCDFDGDATSDKFLATGVTWWFFSGATNQWAHLQRSSVTANLSLADVNQDGYCDVLSKGWFSSGGTGSWQPIGSSVSPLPEQH